ncbi:MAG: response regulator transcription factor [Thermaceae bacterium]|nr:response regulator transcription factor [Thermaceae bacterium]
MQPTRVLIVSDDPWSRAGLAALLGGEEGLELVGQTGNDGDFSVYEADVLLWDLSLGDGDFVDLNIPVLVLVSDENRATQMLSGGAKGVLLRASEPEVLSAALQAVARGLVIVEPALLNLILPEPSQAELEPTPLTEELTARELEVLHLLAAGLSNKAIAGRLEFSEHTAKFHVAQILNKLGVESRTEAVVRAAQLGLILL